VYIGIALEIASIVRALRDQSCAISSIVCSGGAARDMQLVRTIAAALRIPCKLATAVGCSSVGAALLAHDALAPGVFPCLPATSVRPAQLPLPVEAWLVGREGVLRRGE
jgi:ribulose kinase